MMLQSPRSLSFEKRDRFLERVRLRHYVSLLAVTLSACSTAFPCKQPPSHAREFFSARNRQCEHVLVELPPVCIRRLTGAILAGPEGNSWPDGPNKFDPRPESGLASAWARRCDS